MNDILFMSPPRVVPSHHSGGRMAATTMATGAPPATSVSKMSTTNALQAATAPANHRPPKPQISFRLPGFRIDCPFPGCSAKLDGKRDVFCPVHMQSLSNKASKPLTGTHQFTESSSTTSGSVPIAATVVVARPHPISSQPQPSLSPAPGINSPSPQRQLSTSNPRKLLLENEKNRPIIMKRKSAPNPPRVIMQQPTPKYTTPPIGGDPPTGALPQRTTTSTSTISPADPPAAPSPVVHSPPISPRSTASVNKRPNFSGSLGHSSESRLNEQTTHRPLTLSQAAKRPTLQQSPSKEHTSLKTLEDKNAFAPPRFSRAQPIRKMALPATVNFISKPKQSSTNPSPEMPPSNSFEASSDKRQNTDDLTKINQPSSWTSHLAPSLRDANADPKSPDRMRASTNGFHFKPATPGFKAVQSNKVSGKQTSDNGQPRASGTPPIEKLPTSEKSQANNLQQSSALPQQSRRLLQANGHQQPNGHILKSKSSSTQAKPHEAAVNQTRPPVNQTYTMILSDSDVDMQDADDSDPEPKRTKNHISPKKLRPQLIPVKRLQIPAHPSVEIVPAAPTQRAPVVSSQELSEFDAAIYSQEGASAPPAGFILPKRKPLVKTKPQPRVQEDAMDLDDDEDKPPPKPKEDEPLYTNIDPRVHWPKVHSEEWYAKKQAEIAARPNRKANFGKAAQRMRELKPVEPTPVSSEDFEKSLPEKIQNNPAWVRALKRLHEIPVEDLEPEQETGQSQTNGVGHSSGGEGSISSGPGYVNGERKIKKLKKTGSAFQFRMDVNGNGTANGTLE
ncbi:hypothetical protein QBC38DRAFT_98309 [Podospora fimiseda]|uniref:Uncharacterized protein n=1 Tax=Podospora fimiseda TaxID=252190 RepID=A0AAN7BU22_9PEZI|nr:hypothetical protein QBC38DRAFT_98309 [Podospora fimiseda]